VFPEPHPRLAFSLVYIAQKVKQYLAFFCAICQLYKRAPPCYNLIQMQGRALVNIEKE